MISLDHWIQHDFYAINDPILSIVFHAGDSCSFYLCSGRQIFERAAAQFSALGDVMMDKIGWKGRRPIKILDLYFFFVEF